MHLRSLWSYLCLSTGDLVALLVLRPNLTDLAGDLASPHRWVDSVGADAAAAALAGLLLWLTAVWLGLGLVIVLLTALPGSAGRCAQAVCRVLLPRVLYRLLVGATGAGVLLAPMAATPALASTPARAAGLALAAVGQPVLPTPMWPTTAPEPGHPAPAPVATAPRGDPPETVTVRRGDSLWSIAASRLGAGVDDAAITAAWRRLYTDNRAAIGPDPGLIRPGLRLDLRSITAERS